MGKQKVVKTTEEQCQKTQEDNAQQNKKQRSTKRKKLIHKGKHEETKSNGDSQNEEPKVAEHPLLKVEQIPVQFLFHQNNDYICSLCLNYIVKAMCGPCGHSFCEICISQYLLFFDECAKCDKKLRTCKMSYNLLLDNLVQIFIQNAHKEQQADFKERVEQWKDWSNRKKPAVLEVGSQIDIRDSNYIWCRAMIYRTAWKWQESRTKFIYVTYEGKDRRFNDEICEHSPRIATFGFYTQRQDIPHYQVSESGKLQLNQMMQFRNQDTVLYMRHPDSDS